MHDQNLQELHPLGRMAASLIVVGGRVALTPAIKDQLGRSLTELHDDPGLEPAMHSLVAIAAQLDSGGSRLAANELLVLAATAADALIAQKKRAFEQKAEAERKKQVVFAEFKAEVVVSRDKPQPVVMTDDRRKLLRRAVLGNADLEAARAGLRVGSRGKGS